MNFRLPRLIIIVPLLFVLFGPNFRDATAGVAKPPPPNIPAAPNCLLSQAYAILSLSERSYHGHRIRAMHHIAAAAKEFGITLQGTGHGREQRVVSDEQLITAQRILQQALPTMPPKAKEHVQKALEELSIAISLK